MISISITGGVTPPVVQWGLRSPPVYLRGKGFRWRVRHLLEVVVPKILRCLTAKKDGKLFPNFLFYPWMIPCTFFALITSQKKKDQKPHWRSPVEFARRSLYGRRRLLLSWISKNLNPHRRDHAV